MAVLVQRMIAKERAGLLYPFFAGVAFSRNFYPWTERLKVEDGVVW